MKLVEYVCANKECPGSLIEEIFGDTEPQPEFLNAKCEHCGGPMIKGYQVKKNAQVWKNS